MHQSSSFRSDSIGQQMYVSATLLTNTQDSVQRVLSPLNESRRSGQNL